MKTDFNALTARVTVCCISEHLGRSVPN
jgi:hypothetical protein